MKPSYEAAEMIEDAADLIEKQGWFRGDLFGHRPFHEPGKLIYVCAAIAIEGGATIGHLKNWERTNGVCGLVSNALELPPVVGYADPRMSDASDNWFTVVAWNNHPDRTKQEVLDGLRLAAKRVRIQADALP